MGHHQAIESHLRATACELGFNLIGITPATPSPRLNAYLQWVNAGMHGTMGYLTREDRLIRRKDLNVILPGVRSIIIVGLDYAAFNIPIADLKNPARGRIARYAWNQDYHDIMIPRLEKLARLIKQAHWLQAKSHSETRCRVYVDTGAILERSHAHQAGLGFIGKNTMLIHPRRGSYFFLGEILTTLEFSDTDSPMAESRCANCTRCLNACPTAAFPRPYVLDARRCISYLTIEYKGSVPENLRPLMGNWIYGCDICQEVCPFVRRFTIKTQEPLLQTPSIDTAAPRLQDLLALTPDDFKTRFMNSPIQRIKYERFMRNVCVAAGNSAQSDLIPLLEKIVRQKNDLPLAAEHAQWAICQLQSSV